jgi:hypothetical protein
MTNDTNSKPTLDLKPNYGSQEIRSMFKCTCGCEDIRLFERKTVEYWSFCDACGKRGPVAVTMREAILAWNCERMED